MGRCQNNFCSSALQGPNCVTSLSNFERPPASGHYTPDKQHALSKNSGQHKGTTRQACVRPPFRCGCSKRGLPVVTFDESNNTPRIQFSNTRPSGLRPSHSGSVYYPGHCASCSSGREWCGSKLKALEPKSASQQTTYKAFQHIQTCIE